MWQRNRFLTLLFSLVVLMTGFPFRVSANSPAPSPWFCFSLSNLPEGTAYVDLLILLPESDPMYTQLNPENIPEGFAADAEILSFSEGEYRSYTFHHVDSIAEIFVGSSREVYFFCDREYRENRYDHMERVSESGTVKLAMLDASGNILKVSSVLSLRPKEFMTYLTGNFAYDGTTDTFEVDSDGGGIGGILYGFCCLAGTVFTCLAERLVSIPFKLNKQYGRLILWTNLVSQALMYAGYAIFYSFIFWKYSYATIALEVLIYLGEYLVYRKKMPDIPNLKCFAYAVTANTVSLAFGLIIL